MSRACRREDYVWNPSLQARCLDWCLTHAEKWPCSQAPIASPSGALDLEQIRDDLAFPAKPVARTMSGYWRSVILALCDEIGILRTALTLPGDRP